MADGDMLTNNSNAGASVQPYSTLVSIAIANNQAPTTSYNRWSAALEAIAARME
jgi:hypothetical protein